MTDHRLRNHDLLYGHRRSPPSLWIIALFAAIGFVVMFAVLSSLTGRFGPTPEFNQVSAPTGSTIARGLPRP